MNLTVTETLFFGKMIQGLCFEQLTAEYEYSRGNMDIINKFGTKTSRWLNNTVKSHLTNIFQQGEKNMSEEVVERPAATKSVPTVVRGTTLDVSSYPATSKHEGMFEKAQASIRRHFLEKNAPSHYDGAFE